MQVIKKKAAIILFVIISIFLAVQNGSATREGARRAVRGAVIALSSYGFDYRDSYDLGVLDRGQSYTMARTLYRGNEYALLAGGCEYTRDIDVYVYDRNWNLISYDSDYDQVALANFDASYSGTYYVRVKMYSATSDDVHWSLVYGYR
ncbi:hypothetical protein [Phaeodactylibacter xiamenensis]|jgi:hypothetical protein|uniref:hypothetical protein n=1 Tax=Phaeodactylibacter xiamenensis TaxID=1524460 RepID=UPI0024A8C105|nr:hypothetical protein [Phaeodactylibacter xiamenensis]